MNRPATLTRRHFLLSSAASALALPSAMASSPGDSPVTIDRIDVFPLRYPMTGYFKFFAGAHGAEGRAAVIVKITASDGTVGWGQSVPIEKWSYETLEAATSTIQEYLAPELIGRDPTDIAGAHAIMDRTIAPAFSTGMPITRAGIDLGLYDLWGKLAGKSLCQLWGMPRGGPLTLSWTVNARSLDEVDTIMQAGSERGFRNFNIKVAPDPKFDVQLAKRVRQLAPNGFLWADANGGYDVATAIDTAPKLADASVDVLEAPLRPNQLHGYQRLKQQGALPIFMDEGVVSPIELNEFIRLGMLDGLAMKPSRCGGLMSAKAQIEMVLDRGLRWLGSGLTDPDISLAASLGLYGAFGLKKPAALNGPQFLTADVLAKPLKIADGMAEVPEGPGLGIQVDEEKVVELMKRSKA